MRVLAVGNMYPPHHFGGYELVWRAAMRHLERHGHLVRIRRQRDRLLRVDAFEARLHGLAGAAEDPLGSFDVLG